MSIQPSVHVAKVTKHLTELRARGGKKQKSIWRKKGVYFKDTKAIPCVAFEDEFETEKVRI